MKPFTGINDSRTQREFIAEYDRKFGALSEEQAKDTFVHFFDRRQFLWVESLQLDLTLNNIKTRLMEECWSYEIQALQYLAFQNVELDQKKDTTVGFVTHEYKILKDSNMFHAPSSLIG